MSRRVLVCGGRDFTDAATVDRVLFELHAENPISVIIHGDYRGADMLAKRWAYRAWIPHLPFPANWKVSGGAAGPIRNSRMLREGKPDLVVAFPGGDGTADMVAKAERAHVEVLRVEVPTERTVTFTAEPYLFCDACGAVEGDLTLLGEWHVGCLRAGMFRLRPRGAARSAAPSP